MRYPGSLILLVDDDPNDVLFLKRAFRRAGVRQNVHVVRDGEEAVAYLEGTGGYGDRVKHPFPCLVLLDVKMPRKNGLEVLRWLRAHEQFKDLPVCMVTSSDENRDREEAESQGIEAYCVKPVAFDELVRLAEKIRLEAEEHCEKPDSCPSTEK
jgi:CheY-like chemotaxis protein